MAAAGERGAYVDGWGVCGIRRFTTAAGVRTYLIPIETFPDHVNNVYLLIDGGRATLFDVGSQIPRRPAGPNSLLTC